MRHLGVGNSSTMVKGIKGSIESYEKSRRNSADIHENVYVKWVHFMKFSILFGGRLWTYFAQFWSLLVQKRQSWRRGSAVFGSRTSSTSLWRLKPVNIPFHKRNISNEVWRTGCSKMKYACRVPLMISVEKRTKRNIQGEIDELYCNLVPTLRICTRVEFCVEKISNWRK